MQPLTPYARFLLLLLACSIVYAFLYGCSRTPTPPSVAQSGWTQERAFVLDHIASISDQSIPFEITVGPITDTAQNMTVALRFVTPEDIIIDAHYTTKDIQKTLNIHQYTSAEPYWNVFSSSERERAFVVLRQQTIAPSEATHIALTTLGLPDIFNDASHGGLILQWGKEIEQQYDVPMVWSFLYLERMPNDTVKSSKVIIDARTGAILKVFPDW